MNPTHKTIMVVDDELAVLNMLTDFFHSMTYIVMKVDNAEEATKMLSENVDVDLVITDINLPGMSGIDLLRSARAIRPEIPVILITGHQSIDFAISAVKHGAHDYIQKPFDLAYINKTVEKVFRYRHTAQQKDTLFQFAKSMNINFDIKTSEVDAGVVSEYLAKFLFGAGFCNRDEFHQYNVAFMETLVNSIEHGNLELPSSIKGDEFEGFQKFEELRSERLKDPFYGDRLVRVAFQYNENLFSLTISDEGPGFDWRLYLDSNRSGSPISEATHGRGFMLILHIIDEVYFNEKGNSITLVKSRPVAEDSGSDS